jgi:hypothetical protein
VIEDEIKMYKDLLLNETNEQKKKVKIVIFLHCYIYFFFILTKLKCKCIIFLETKENLREFYFNM